MQTSKHPAPVALDLVIVSHSGIGPFWAGTTHVVSETRLGQLEEIFRLFQRVDPDDQERLESIGYELPSLSVGDMVAVRQHSERFYVGWHCGSLGWQTVEVYLEDEHDHPSIAADLQQRIDTLVSAR